MVEKARRRETMLHLDMDAFYASVEQLLHPELRGKPVAVGGASARSVVAAASYEARVYGVHSAMPMTEARRRCPRLIVVRGDMNVYADYSRRIAEIFERFTPDFEMVSMDEAYLDLSGMELAFGPPFKIAAALQAAIVAETGLPCSMGLSANRLVSKVASGLAKPRGFLRVLAGCEKEFLAPLPVGKIPGVGKKTLEKLDRMGVATVGDFAAIDSQRWEALLGRWGTALHDRANGRAPSAVQQQGLPKSVGAETTFSTDTMSLRFLDRALAALCEQTGYRLRRQRLEGRTVTLKLRYFDFKTVSRAFTLPEPTAFDHLVFQTARRLLERELADRPARVRLIGVRVSGIRPAVPQLDLFADNRARVLYDHLDRVKARYGVRAVRFGSAGPETGG